MSKRLIFVSCGQRTEAERHLGRRICQEIDETPGFQSYFAENVQSLSALGHNILDALGCCSGAVVVLHPRGEVRTPGGELLCVRSSVWINQEVAILAYRQQYEGREIPILAFKDPATDLEGAMTALIVNPQELGTEAELLQQLHAWLGGNGGQGPSSDRKEFETKWRATTSEDRSVLSALVAEGGSDVKESSILRRLREDRVIGGRASEVLRHARLALSQANLVRLRQNQYDGDEMSLHETWKWHLCRALREGVTPR
jgi:hypothetical protein